MMRRGGVGVAVMLLLLTVTAGCVEPGHAGDEPIASEEAGWRLDCPPGGQEASASWEQECLRRITFNPGSKTEPWLRIDPTDPQRIVVGVKDNDPAYSDDCVWNGVYVSDDGGTSWSEGHIGGRMSERRPGGPYWGYACNTDPAFDFAPDGALYYGVELYSWAVHQEELTGLPPLGWQLLLARSDDAGVTWDEPITFHPDKGTVTDYGRMAVNPVTGTVFETINSFHTQEPWTCHLVASRDDGASAEPPVLVAPLEPRTSDLMCRDLAVAPDGTVTAILSGAPLPEFASLETFVARSDNDGASFDEVDRGFSFGRLFPEESHGAAHRMAYPVELAYDASYGPYHGRLYVAYNGVVDGQFDTFVRTSDDQGVTWNEARSVHATSEHQQYLPNLAIAADGSVHVVFLDRRWDPDDLLIDVVWSHSLDGGSTWNDQRVTNVSWNGDLGRHQTGDRPFIGDYLGIDAVGGEVYFAVPDTSLGHAVVAVGHATRGE